MKTRLPIIALLLCLTSSHSFAGGTDTDRAAWLEARLAQRFGAADKNGDGRLGRDEAQAGMPKVHASFDAIDGNHDGFVSKAEIVSAMQARLAERGQ